MHTDGTLTATTPHIWMRYLDEMFQPGLARVSPKTYKKYL